MVAGRLPVQGGRAVLRLSFEEKAAALRGASAMEKRFPGVIAWWGLRNRLWLALVPTDQGRVLIEAPHLEGLAERLRQWEAAR